MAEEEIRLLACSQCKTVEELPDFQGPAEYDTLLNTLVSRHGPPENRHIGALMRINKAQWRDPNVQSEVVKRISDQLSGGETGLGHEFYDTKNTFIADAFHCWKQHNKVDLCPDYKSDAKLLIPDTKEERLEAGASKFIPGQSGPKRHLCEFCPVHTNVTTIERKRAGQYDA